MVANENVPYGVSLYSNYLPLFQNYSSYAASIYDVMPELINKTRFLSGWLVGWLVGWLFGWWLRWLVGWLVIWLVGWLVGWLVSWLFGWASLMG